MGLALKEKDFRAFVQEHDWTKYQSKHVAVGCSVDAIIPTWAYMLISIQLAPNAKTTVFGTLADLEKTLYSSVLNQLDLSPYRDGRIVIKGCSKESVPTDVYVQISTLFQPIVKSLFFGEPCSTVPLYKQKKPFSAGIVRGIFGPFADREAINPRVLFGKARYFLVVFSDKATN